MRFCIKLGVVRHTFFNTSGKAQRGIHDAFTGHRSVALVLTLLTFYGKVSSKSMKQLNETKLPDLLDQNS